MATAQATKLRVQRNPFCTAVRGCRDRAFILCYSLVSKDDVRLVRICARHLGRWKRTGDLGPAERYPRSMANHAKRDRLMQLEFQKLTLKEKLPWVVIPLSRGQCGVAWSETYPLNGVTDGAHVPNNRLAAFARRGWITLGPWSQRGTRSARLNKAGREVLRT